MSEHSHDHRSGTQADQRRLLIALTITGVMTIVELVGGILSNSLALLGDAGHMFTDTLALSLSFFAIGLARRPADAKRTYGYLRAEILAALLNGAILVGIGGVIFYEAYRRFNEPPEIEGGLMLVVAAIGLAANLAGIFFLHSASRQNLNVKGAFLHMWSDALSSIGVIAAAGVILLTDWNYADPLISILIGILILRGAIQLVWESGNILLEAAPRHLDAGRIAFEIARVPGVRDIHDIHIWTLTSGVHALSAHLLIEDQMVSRSAQIVAEVNQRLNQDFGIAHTTLQIECEVCRNAPVCQIENGRRQ